MKAILTDIEGTTSSISFVKDVLFPYARKALPDFIRANADKPEVRQWLDAVSTDAPQAQDDAARVLILQEWIDADRKHTALKALQGMIWETGYREGDFTSHMYPDAVEMLKRWHAEGLALYVYSSGSVSAQKLLFGYSSAGDLKPLFSGWFDTQVGGKREASSYVHIIEHIDIAPSDILFLSDVVAELDAARDAGLHTTLLDRLEDYPTPRNALTCNGHTRVTRFDEIAVAS